MCADPGAVNFTGVNTVAIGGAITWDGVLDGMLENEKDNHSNATIILSPTSVNALRKLKNTSEVNNYSRPPAAVQSLNVQVTSAMPDTTIIVGDMSKYLIGLRQAATVEISTEAGSAFENNQVFIRALWRGAFSVERADALCTLTGIV